MEELMGKLVDVEIIEATKFSMMGQILEEEDEISVKSPASIQVKTPVVETSFQGSLFYKLSMAMLVIACFIRIYHIFFIRYGANDKPNSLPTRSE